MGRLDITTLSSLSSRITRRDIAGTTGIRQLLNGRDTSTWGGLLSSAFTGLGRFIGWGLQKILAPILSATATTVWGWIVGGTIYLLNFNFAATDQELEQRLTALETALAGQLGDLVGTTLGWSVCGYLPGLALLKINQAMAWHVLKNVNEEALDEIFGEMGTFATFVRNYQAQKTFTGLYMAVRALIKNAANEDSDTLAGGAITLFLNRFPQLKKVAKTWGEKGGQSWTISQGIENLVEKIENKNLQEFVENVLESFGEACIEAGYIVAAGIDYWHMQQRLAGDQILGNQRTIEIFPDRSINEPFREGIVLSGRDELLRPTIVQTMATHQQLRHRDVGVIVGEQIQTYVRKISSDFQIRIYWTNRKDGTQGDIVTYTTINNISRTKLDWEQIKRIAGGDNGRLFGNITVKGFMSDNSRITVKVATEQQGVKLIRDLKELTLNEIDWNTTNSKLAEGRLATIYRDEWIDNTALVYPYKMILFNKYRILNQAQQGELGTRGKTISREWYLPLWEDDKPPEWDEMIQELLTVPGVNPT